jgi:hypothetical protein
MKLCMALSAVLLLGGCTVSPTIDYHAWNEPHDDSWIPYQLTDTTIVIGINKPANDQNNTNTNTTTTPPKKPKPAPVADAASTEESGTLLQPISHAELYPVTLTSSEAECQGNGCDKTVSAVAVPIPYEGMTLGIEPTRSWFIYTHMAPSYYPNSLRLQSLEISVEDKRMEALDTVGAIAVGSAKIAAGPGAGGFGAHALGATSPPKPKLQLPVIIDLADAKKAQTTPTPLAGNPGWTYTLHFLDDPDRMGFHRSSDVSNVHGAVVTALCRPVAITLTAPTVKLVLGTTVADPDYILPIPLPPSGSVNFGTLCGADVKMQSVTSVKANDFVNAFVSDVQQVRNASRGSGK